MLVGLLDRAVLYLHVAASNGNDVDSWFSFSRSLVAMSSVQLDYFPLARDAPLMQRLATDAMEHVARGLLLPCTDATTCRNTRNLARDVLAELIVHCDNSDGALWDSCPERFLKPLRALQLPAWPSGVEERTSTEDEPKFPCDIPRRAWPEFTAEDFERDFNKPHRPVIVSGMMEGWPAHEWVSEKGSDNWLYLRLAQSIVRSLMRRAHGIAPSDADFSGSGSAGSLFGVPPFKDGATLDNQYINLDDINLAYRQPLTVGYLPPDLVQRSLLETAQCFPSKSDYTNATAQQAAFHIHSRWLLVSAAGSGSGWHIDPWNTSAWNALLHGRKRWALYPPGIDGLPLGVAEASPADFFGKVLGTLSASERPQECVLEEGETMLLPSGWWHTVLNLTPTLAITENRVDDANREAVIEELRSVDSTSMSGKRAARMCNAEGAKLVPFDRGTYPRDCDQRLRSGHPPNPEIMECIGKLEACAATT